MKRLWSILAGLVLASAVVVAIAQTPQKAAGAPAKASAPAAAKAVAGAASSPEKGKVAKAYLPMARKGEGATSPKALAERIRESLKVDATGNRRVRGANATPAEFLIAVKKAGGAVDGVEALPTYLDSLLEGDLPEGKVTMSRVVYTRDAKGTEKFVLDVEKGFPREARKGERGWYDANTNFLVLAGDCGNSPLVETKGPKVLAPAVSAPVPVPSTPAPATSAPTASASAPAPSVSVSQCSEPPYAQLNIWSAKALQVSGVREMIAGTGAGKGSHFEANRVSRAFGAKFRAMHERGDLPRSSEAQDVTITLLKRDGTETLMHRRQGLTVGFFKFATPANFVEGDAIRFVFADLGKLASPVSDLRIAWSEFLRDGGCGKVTHIHAVDAK